MRRIFKNKYGKRFAVMKYEPGIAWTENDEETEFDCVVLNFWKGMTEEVRDLLATEVAARVFDWVDVCGFDCELIHDRIDAKAVVIGRQEKVGDGYPMTTWHNELKGMSEIAKFAGKGGMCTQDLIVVLVVGEEVEVEAFCVAMEMEGRE